MGLGKTIQLLAFIQLLKVKKKLQQPILLIAPTSVLTNWKREALIFTPELNVYEHYGSRRPSTPDEIKKALKNSNMTPAKAVSYTHLTLPTKA